jgi:Mg/Co/Ni transporter MgtE
MNASSAVAILRLSKREDAKQYLSLMSHAHAAHLRMRLRFSESVIGAFVDNDILTLNEEHRVTDALRLFKARTSKKTGHDIFVLDSSNHLTGVVDLAELLAARESALVKQLATTPPVVLNARAAIQTVITHPAWLTHDNLPVTTRDGIFQGVLWRSNIKGTEKQLLSDVTDNNESANTRSALADIFWLGVGAIFTSNAESSHRDKVEQKDEA